MARNIRQSVGSTIKAKDLANGPIVVTIQDIKLKKFEDEDKEKNQVVFEDFPKDLILNVTNTNIICDMFGDEDVDWIGQKIELYQGKTAYKGKMVNCISVREPGSE